LTIGYGQVAPTRGFHDSGVEGLPERGVFHGVGRFVSYELKIQDKSVVANKDRAYLISLKEWVACQSDKV